MGRPDRWRVTELPACRSLCRSGEVGRARGAGGDRCAAEPPEQSWHVSWPGPILLRTGMGETTKASTVSSTKGDRPAFGESARKKYLHSWRAELLGRLGLPRASGAGRRMSRITSWRGTAARTWPMDPAVPSEEVVKMTRAPNDETPTNRDSPVKTVVAVIGVIVNAARFIWEILHP